MVSCSQPGKGEGGRPAVACRQTEVTEGPPRVRPATLKKHAQSVTVSLATRRDGGGNGFRSTDHTFGMNEALAVVNSVKISRAFAAEYLAFHALIFFFDALWIIMICQDRKTSRPPTAAFHISNFRNIKATELSIQSIQRGLSPLESRFMQNIVTISSNCGLLIVFNQQNTSSQ